MGLAYLPMLKAWNRLLQWRPHSISSSRPSSTMAASIPSKEIIDAYRIQWRRDASHIQWRRASPIPINGVDTGSANWTLSFAGEDSLLFRSGKTESSLGVYKACFASSHFTPLTDLVESRPLWSSGSELWVWPNLSSLTNLGWVHQWCHPGRPLQWRHQ